MLRVILREINNLADVDQTGAELSALASACLDAALEFARCSVTSAHGDVRDANGNRVPLVALGMGKLGGWELNLGSDIDLIFFYATDTATVGQSEITPHEYFSKVVRRATRAIGEVTEDGFVFRVDLRLRPEGSQGPLVNSLASAERYYESFGRTWERAALLRARPIAGNLEFGEELLETLRPFVYRRAVNPAAAATMHQMVAQARRDLRVDTDRDIKLGRGGIRELEFFVQGLQLVWGGQHPELQVTGTIDAIGALKRGGLINDSEAADLEEAWALLRRVEHRIQMLAGYQTHTLPADLTTLAESLGFRNVTDLQEQLERTRSRVTQLFDSLVETPKPPQRHEALLATLANLREPTDLVHRVASDLEVRDATEAAHRLRRAAMSARSPFSAVGQERYGSLAARLLDEVEQAADVDSALRSTTDLCLRANEGYLRLLASDPRLMRRLVGLFGASRTLSEGLVATPAAIANVLTAGGAPSDAEIRQAHEGLSAYDDTEQFVERLREAKRELTLRIGIAHVSDEISGRETGTLLTRVADEQLHAAAMFAWRLSAQSRVEPKSALAIVGLGKLGTSELGFGSDLDVLFLYGDRDVNPPSQASTSSELATPRESRPDAEADGEFFTRVAQRTMRLLSQPAAGGRGYQVDTRLRPSGSRGVLVVSVAAFEHYHATRAESWERLAISRARVVVCEDAGVRERVKHALTQAAYNTGAGRDPSRLLELRSRMERELGSESSQRYHPKLGYGALLDIELLAQWLQTESSEASLRGLGTVDALDALQTRGRLSEDLRFALTDAYQFFRAVEQALALHDDTLEPVLVPGGPRATAVSRRLRLRARDAMTQEAVLQQEWQRHAVAVRQAFESVVGPVGSTAPWSKP